MGGKSPENAQRSKVSRRTMLAALASGVVGMAGCSGSDEDDTGPSEGRSTPPQTTATATPGADDTATATLTDTPSASSATSEQTDIPVDQQYTVTFEHPDEVLVDEPFGMTITGLPPNTRVQVRRGAEQLTAGTTTVTVQTDEKGQIDLTDTRVLDGDVPPDFDVPLPMALIQFRRTQYESPQTVSYGVALDGTDLGSTELTRRIPTGDPDRTLERDGLVGGLFEPADGGQGPGVVVLHGSGGGPDYETAEQLAHRGFTAFALHYFSGPGLPDDLAEVPLSDVERATEFLLDQETTVGQQVGVYGTSKGGELALLAGSQFDTIGAVVSNSGSGVVWEGSSLENLATGRSSWSLDGEPVPYLSLTLDEDNLSAFPEAYRQPLEQATAEQLDAATIPVEQIDGPVLLIAGEGDGIWPSARLHAIAEQRLAENDHPAFDSLVYDAAGHAIAPPYYRVQRTLLGGTMAGRAYASHDHWPRVLETLSAVA
jgi:dienelactone hydrolase